MGTDTGKGASYIELASELRGIAAAMKLAKGFAVLECSIGEPISEEDLKALEPVYDEEGDDDEAEGVKPSVPKELEELSRVFDGAVLKWRAKAEKGRAIKGEIYLPALASMDAGEYLGGWEGDGVVWDFAPKTTSGTVFFVDDIEPGAPVKPSVFVLDRDSYAQGESMELTTAIAAMVDRLGIPGWEIALFGDPDEDDRRALEICNTQAASIRKAIGLPVPAALLPGTRHSSQNRGA